MGGVSAAVYAIVACLRLAEDQHTELFHIYYQPLFVMLAMLCFWGIDVRLFEERRIAYGACFSPADQAFLLTSTQIFQACSLAWHAPGFVGFVGFAAAACACSAALRSCPSLAAPRLAKPICGPALHDGLSAWHLQSAVRPSCG
jgi:hypothetical protein